jgi:hypothetical protein
VPFSKIKNQIPVRAMRKDRGDNRAGADGRPAGVL